MLRKLGIVLAAVMALALGGCGYNDLQRQDEGIKAAWSEVVNQYQRRADLVPNLVNTVKGYAQQEQQVLTEVTNARANVGSIKATPELINDPAGVPEIHPGAKPAAGRAVAPARRVGELSAAEVRCAVPRPAIAARGDGEPHRRRAQPLHQDGAGIQHDGAPVPDEPHGDDLQDEREAELHRRRRRCGQRAAEGRFRQGAGRSGAGCGTRTVDARARRPAAPAPKS